MNKKLLISLLSVFVLSATAVMADDTNTTNSRPQLPQFSKNGGQPPQMNGENGQKGQFDGRRPSKKPDSKPGGDMTPPDWDTSNTNGQPPEPPQFNGNNSNGRPPMPPKQNDTNDSTGS